MFKIAIDLMGGDNAPKQPIKGIESFIKSNLSNDVFFYMVGKEKEILKNLDKNIFHNDNFKIINTNEFIAMSDNPIKVIKEKPNSSMIKCLELLKNNTVDSVISAGNTGALIFCSTILVKKIPGVKKVILAPKIPNKHGSFILADVGANININPKNYTNIADLCTIYSQLTAKSKTPSVHLLNIGQEENKGTPDLIEAYKQLKINCKNFKGNIEPRYIMNKKTDIVLCDGLIGNIVLKLTEGLSHYLLDLLIDSSQGTPLENLKNLKSIFDFELSTILLGLNGVVLKCHGSSNHRSFKYAIEEAQRLNQAKLIDKINYFFNPNL